MLYGIILSADSDYAAQYNATDTLETYGLAMARDGFSISAPKVRTEYKEVRGMDGVLDATDSPQGYPVFENRKIKFKLFHVPPFQGWDIEQYIQLRTEIMASWQGKRIRITLPDDMTRYWVGRLSVGDMEDGNYLIECEAVVYPYKLKHEQTSLTVTDLTTSWKTYTLTNERRYVVPTITIEQDTDIQFLQGAVTVPPEINLELPTGETSASFQLPDALLIPGSNQFKAKLPASGTNSLTITYREGTF